MMIDFSSVLVVAAFAALVPIVYAMMRILGLAITERHRHELARLGEEFLARDDVTEGQKACARMWLNDPFKGHMAWIMVALLPLILLMVFALAVIRLLGMQEAPSTRQNSLDSEKALRKLSKRGLVASLGASPVAATLFFAEVILLTPVALLTRTFKTVKKSLFSGPLNLHRLSS